MSKTAAQTTPDEMTRRRMKWISALTALLGLWIAASSFLLTDASQAGFWSTEMGEANYWNNIIIGTTTFLISAYNLYRLMNGRSASAASTGLLATLGLWMILAPFVFDVPLMDLLWSDILSGSLLSLLAGYNMYAERKAKQTRATGT